MNNSINYSGFIDVDVKSDDDFEPYGYSEADARPESSHNSTFRKTTGKAEHPDES